MYQFLKPTTLAAIYVDLEDAKKQGSAKSRELFEQDRVWEALVAVAGAENALFLTNTDDEEETDDEGESEYCSQCGTVWDSFTDWVCEKCGALMCCSCEDAFHRVCQKCGGEFDDDHEHTHR